MTTSADPRASGSGTTDPTAPTVSDGGVLATIGEIVITPAHTSHVVPRYLLKQGARRYLLVTEKMRDLVVAIDGRSTVREIALKLSVTWQRPVSTRQLTRSVQQLIGEGIVRDSQSPTRQLPTRSRGGGLFAVRVTLPILPARLVSLLAGPLSAVFSRSAAIVLAVVLIVSRIALYSSSGYVTHVPISAGESYAVLAAVVASVFMHELGHAAAVRRWGGEPGAIGCTLYFIYPALYTDTRGAWKLTRKQRVAVDLGGAYVQLISTIPLAAAYLTTRSPAAWSICALVDSTILLSLNPFLRFDGYWALADGLGVPNLHKESVQLLIQSVLRVWTRFRQPHDAAFPPRTRAVLTIYGAAFSIFVALVVSASLRHGPAWFLAYGRSVHEAFRVVRDDGWAVLVATPRRLLTVAAQTAIALGLVMLWVRVVQSLVSWVHWAISGLLSRKQTTPTELS